MERTEKFVDALCCMPFSVRDVNTASSPTPSALAFTLGDQLPEEHLSFPRGESLVEKQKAEWHKIKGYRPYQDDGTLFPWAFVGPRPAPPPPVATNFSEMKSLQRNDTQPQSVRSKGSERDAHDETTHVSGTKETLAKVRLASAANVVGRIGGLRRKFDERRSGGKDDKDEWWCRGLNRQPSKTSKCSEQ